MGSSGELYLANRLFCINHVSCQDFIVQWSLYVPTVIVQWSLYVPTVEHSAILRSAHTVYLCVLCGSENKQRLFTYTALTDWFV